MATSYTSNKKIGALDAASTPLAATNEVVINQNGDILKTPLSAVEAKIFDAKTALTPVAGTEVVVVRQTDNVLRQVALNDIVKPLLITNAMVSESAGIVDTKLATINTAGKVTNQAVQAVATNTANRIVTRDGSGNFEAGTVTASLSGNASTATTLQTGRTIALTGDVTYTSPSFNGSANVTAASTIANNAVTTGKIADSNVTTAKISDSNVTTAKIADSNVTTGKIADSAVTTAKIADSNVTTAKIADSNVTTGKIADSAVTTAKIADGTIVNADINASAAIAGTKVDPNFGSQSVVTTGGAIAAQFESLSADPIFKLTETDATSDNKRWDIIAGSEALYIRAVNDAYSTAQAAIEIQRTGTTIDSVSMPNGNVGINTNNPTSKLTVVDNSANDAVRITQTGSGNALVVEDSANPDATPFVVTADGSVGIGTAPSAGVKLDVVGGIRSALINIIDGAAATYRFLALNTNNLARWHVGTTDDAESGSDAGSNFFLHRWSDNGTFLERVLLISRSTGNIGINTASPTEKLEVNGTVKATAFSGPLTGNVTGTASAIADGSVSTAKILDGNVTLAKLVTAVQQALVPAGAVQAFAMNSAPAGWLAADGTNVSRSTYAALFSAIGTTYGAGDGSTTFALPDLRGYFVRGSGTNGDGTAAGTFGEKQADLLKNHKHDLAYVRPSSSLVGVMGASNNIWQASSFTETRTTTDPNGSLGGTETRPKNIALLYCIKF
jgi:microcystin-dependent protein